MLLWGLNNFASAQSCTNNGQNPLSAFPVCGTNIFYQASVPICSGSNVPSPGCAATDYSDKNPFYYKFTCFAAGTLHFKINPNTNSDDYDWVLYDVTGRNPNEIYTNAALTIASNWSGTGGNTGMDNSGNNQYVCEGIGRPRWSSPANLTVGRNYLLMVSHFTNSQSGYALSFGGGTAVITDPTPPKLLSAKADCEGKKINIKLNKKMLCNSLATNGTDFFITPAAGINILNASSLGCSTNFDTDTLTLTLATPLLPGNYILNVKNGSDANTLKDYCDLQIPLTDQAFFKFAPAVPTPIDSIAMPTCAPQTIQLIFANKQIKCNSISADGSDFAINGTYPTSILSATAGNCVNGFTEAIILKLSHNLYNKGTFTITLQTGSDGNSIIDECNLVSIIGSSKSFNVKDTVNANFTTVTKLGCIIDTIIATNNLNNDLNNWQWIINNIAQPNNNFNPQFLFTNFGIKNIMLVASNGFCTDTATTSVDLDNYIEPQINFNIDNCPKEIIPFMATPIGKNLTYLWQFGNGATDTAKNTAHQYIDFGIDKTYNVAFTITNNLGCQKTIIKPINVLKICGLFVPTAFTPNGDGNNDRFGPLYAAQAINLRFRVFNRFGQMVYQTNNWRNGWDGTIKGVPQPTSTFAWTMQYTNRADGKLKYGNGTATLIR